jgi:hypothetical protein
MGEHLSTLLDESHIDISLSDYDVPDHLFSPRFRISGPHERADSES